LKRCGIAIWCDKGLKDKPPIKIRAKNIFNTKIYIETCIMLVHAIFGLYDQVLLLGTGTVPRAELLITFA